MWQRGFLRGKTSPITNAENRMPQILLLPAQESRDGGVEDEGEDAVRKKVRTRIVDSNPRL